MTRPALLFALTLVWTAPVDAQETPAPEDFTVRIEVRRWSPSLDAEIQASSDRNIGTLIDVVNDLDVGDKSTFELRATLKLGKSHKVRGSYTPLDYDGDTRIEQQIRFEDTLYPRLARLVTSLKGGYYTGEYEWAFKSGKYGYFSALFGVKVFDVDALLVGPEQGEREQNTLRLPIPVVGIAGRAYLGERVSLTGEISGMSIGERANVVEVETGARVHVTDWVALGVSYRLLSLNAVDANDQLHFRIGGATFGAEVGF